MNILPRFHIAAVFIPCVTAGFSHLHRICFPDITTAKDELTVIILPCYPAANRILSIVPYL